MPLDRLTYALEAAAVGLWDWKIASGELWWSDNLAEIHGIPPDEFDGTFECFRAFIHPSDRDEFDIALRRALDGGEDFAVEFRVPGRDRITRWIRGQGRAFRDADGHPVRVIGIGLDVTNRRRQENALRQLGVIADASSDAIIAINRAGIVTAWNPGAQQLYGYSEAEMVGSPIWTISPPNQVAEIDAILARLATGEHVADLETERLHRDGSRVFVSLNSVAIVDDDGSMVGAVTIARDMTARRKEEDRQRLLAEMGSVLNASLDAATTLQTVAALAIKRFSDWCVVHLIQPDGSVEQVAIAHSDERKVEWVRSLQEKHPYDPDAPSGVANVLRTGVPEFYEAITEEMIQAATDDPELLDALHEIGLASVAIVPMVVRGSIIGAISMYTAESKRRFSVEDRDLAMELARRSALAIDNAMLFARVQAAERQLRLVADNLPALVSYVGNDLRYRFVNRRYSEWFGTPSEELIDRHVLDLARSGTEDLVAKQLETAMSGQPVRYDVDVTYPKAGRRHVEIDYVPDRAPNGDVRGVVALIVDITERERNQRRVAALNQLTAALAGALTESEVAECIVTLGVAALDGAAGSVLSSSDDGSELTLRAIRGFPRQFRPGDRFPSALESLFGQSMRDSVPYILPTWEERIREQPQHATFGPDSPRGAFVALPLTVEDRRLGAFAIAFADDRLFQRENVDFMLALANVCAQAFDRARIYDAERRALEQAEADRARVSFLADASRILAASLDIDVELNRVMQLAANSLADWCTTHLFGDDGGLRRIGSVHRDPGMSDTLRALDTEYEVLPGSFRPAVRARIEAEQSWFDPHVDQARLAEDAVDQRHLDLLRQLGFAAEIVSPLIAGGRLFGTMTFLRSADSPPFTEADVALAEELCSRTALAIDNARLLKGVQASETRYRSLFEGVADAMLIVDRNGIVRGGNPAASRLLSVDQESLVDTPLGQYLLEPSATRSLIEDAWLGELEVYRPDGQTVPVEAQSALVDLPTGPAVLIAFRDTTQRRTLERLQRDFLAMVTHDLRSPLAAIRVQSQLMRRRAQYSEQSVDAIIGQTERIARLINALADLVRMDSGRLDLNLQPVDLAQLARNVAEQEQTNVPGREVTVCADGPVTGEWDADRLSQVISNLVGNALKYSGGDAPVIVSVATRSGSAIVSVADSGVGIPEEHIPKLFERFYRADITGAGGLGLGLYIARMLTEAHGGRISVESSAGAGSVFTFELPLGNAVSE